MATLIQGTASNITQGSDYTYAGGNSRTGPQAIKNQIFTMRLDGKPVSFKTRQLPSISDGDRIAAVGTEKNGTLEAVGLRNLTTGADYYLPTTMPLILSALVILLGIPLLAIFIGVIFIALGGWIFYKAWQVHTATNQLKAWQPGLN